jgi:hypothetical protein
MRSSGRGAAAISLWVLFGSAACVRNLPYRVANPVLHETPPSYCAAPNTRYTLSFIEFDDMGELWEPTEGPTELDRALEEIRHQRSESPIVLLFVHGWKNNASDKSGNVWGFRCELGRIASQYGRPVIGVYLGWRGAVTDVPLFKDFTFWNRITAATRIPGAHMTDVILRIMREAKGRDGTRDATLIAVGHSFGGLVLERAVTQALVERIDDAEESGAASEGFFFPADLVVLLNEAGPALQAKQLLDLLWRRQAEFKSRGNNQPLLLSMTSKGDTATNLAFPGGQALSFLKVDLRKYFQTDPERHGPDEFGVVDQASYYLHTAANTEALQSHVIGRKDDSEVQKALADDHKVYLSVTVGNEDFVVIPKARARNTTPYWVMQMPVEFVPDHTTIFRPEFDALLKAFLQQRPEMRLRGRALAPGAIPPEAPKLRLKQPRS